MRRVTLGTSGIETSCLGFGCASLGSRVGAAPALAALAAAFEAGVAWYDLAPLYGGGRAEETFADFLRGRRDRVQVCTKVGLAPAGGSGPKAALKAALMPVARRAVQAVPALRRGLRRSGVQGAQSLPLTPELLRGSLEESLRRLKTDHVDLYALHDASAEALAREPVLRTLEELVRAGKTRAVGVASGTEAALAALGQGAPYGIVQAALPAPGAPDPLAAPVAAAGAGRIVHSVFGVDGSLASLKAQAAADPELRGALLGAGGGDLDAALGELLLDRAFALNPGGVVLVSMFSERSRALNLARAGTPPGPEPELLARLTAA